MTGLIAMLLQSMAGVIAPPPPTVPPAPPRIIMGPDGQQGPGIASFIPGEVRCGDAVVAPVMTSPPAPGGLYATTPLHPIDIRFAIDAEGRPVSIRSDDDEEQHFRRFDMADDVVPALAAWRFARGAPRDKCAIRFTAEAVPVSEADTAILYRFLSTRASSLFRESSPASQAAWDRARKGATCERAGAVRAWFNPPFETIPQRKGTYSSVLLRYDVAKSGKTTGVILLSSSGNDKLASEATKAVKRSRYAPDAPAEGCLYTFYRTQSDPLEAPGPPAPPAHYRDASATCPPREGWGEENAEPWSFLPPLRYPANFNRRDIEGWAIIRYDTAPWGETGNVSIVDAQPAWDFGEEAQQVVRQAQVPTSERGYTGCLTMVRFEIRPVGQSQDPE